MTGQISTPPGPTHTLATQGSRTATGHISGRESKLGRTGMGVLVGFVALAVAAILLTPVALSSRDLLDWAAAPTGSGCPAAGRCWSFCPWTPPRSPAS